MVMILINRCYLITFNTILIIFNGTYWNRLAWMVNLFYLYPSDQFLILILFSILFSWRIFEKILEKYLINKIDKRYWNNILILDIEYRY